jgi:hypothetical protein
MAPVQAVDMDTNHNHNSNTDSNSNNQSLTASFQSNGDHLVEEQQSTHSIGQRDTFSVNQQQEAEEGEIELGQIRSHGNENTNEHEEEEAEGGGNIRELSMDINTNTDMNMNMNITMDTDISLNSSSPSSDEDITHEHEHEHEHNDSDDATTQMTEINISQTASNDDTYYDNIHLNNINTNMNNLLWTEEERTSYQQRRRESLGIELNRIQRSNCIHFSILCSIPLALLVIVLFNSLSDDSSCVGFENVICERNERSFLNAFGNKCVCYAFTL